MKNFKFNLFYFFYFLSFELLCIIAKFISFFSKRIREELKKRSLTSFQLATIKKHKASKDTILFFCSSAGEYEQARPLIDYYSKKGKHIFIVAFSPSGISFMEKRNESHDFILCPLDRYCTWRSIFKILKPSMCFIVRHELWPSFIKLASSYSRLILINASMNRKYNFVSLSMKKLLLSMMDSIFVVEESDLDFYKTIVKDSLLAGDTKYDRVRLRSIEKKEEIAHLKEQLNSYVFSSPTSSLGYKYFIIGSGWHKDIECVFDAYLKIRITDSSWKIICASHDISPVMIDWIKSECTKRNLSYSCFSDPSFLAKGINFDVCIVDVIGRLSELYGVSHLCWVGGAMHYKIHNVLEPAIYGLNIAHGPLYHDQKEACLLVNKGASTVCKDSDELFNWWLDHSPPQINEQTKNLMLSLSFTSKTILNHIEHLGV